MKTASGPHKYEPRSDRSWCLGLLVSLGILMGGLCAASAADPTGSELRQQLARITRRLESTRVDQGALLHENKEWARKITAAKEQLQRRPNTMGQRQLQQDLKKSRSLADQLGVLDKKLYQMTQESIALKRRFIQTLETRIAAMLKQSESMSASDEKRKLLEQVLALQRQKERYQAQIAVESRELLLGLDVQLEETDGPDEIQQKLAIVKDQQDLLHTKIRRIDQQSSDTRKKLRLLQSMLELLRDMRRTEDDEFDLDRDIRIAELEGEIVDLEAWLEIAQARSEDWSGRIKVLTRKAERFSREIMQFAAPLKGGTGDGQ